MTGVNHRLVMLDGHIEVVQIMSVVTFSLAEVVQHLFVPLKLLGRHLLLLHLWFFIFHGFSQYRHTLFRVCLRIFATVLVVSVTGQNAFRLKAAYLVIGFMVS